ncbi:MAG: NADH-quinone reductase, partial [Desulfobacterales bacterium]|nr:NADH-quinone reductase [Desulfobacterales bacterium]
MKELRRYQWLAGVLLVALFLTGCKTGHQFVKKTQFKDTDKIVLTFAGPVDESWATNVSNFSAYEKPDPDIVLTVKEAVLSPEKTKLTLIF